MKKWACRFLAAAAFAAMVALFIAPIPEVVRFFGWVPSFQLVPALLAGSLGVLAVLAVVTALFGRVYCSVICPLGVFQDLVRLLVWPLNRMRRGRGVVPAKTGRRFRFRYAMLALFVPALFFGFAFLVEPYAIFGRFLSYLAGGGEGVPPSLKVFALAFVIAIALAAVLQARWWCNVVCPVGAFLSLFQRFALFRLRIDNAKCTGCDRCVRSCSKGVIAAGKDKVVDHTRCISCYDCAGSCKFGALTFDFRNKKQQ